MKGTKEKIEKAEHREMGKIDPTKLLNMNTEYGRRCQEHIDQIIRKGSQSCCFKRGSIFRISRTVKGHVSDIIVFSWRDLNNRKTKKRQKSWSIKKFGFAGANTLAKEMQDEVYPR